MPYLVDGSGVYATASIMSSYYQKSIAVRNVGSMIHGFERKIWLLGPFHSFQVERFHFSDVPNIVRSSIDVLIMIQMPLKPNLIMFILLADSTGHYDPFVALSVRDQTAHRVSSGTMHVLQLPPSVERVKYVS